MRIYVQYFPIWAVGRTAVMNNTKLAVPSPDYKPISWAAVYEVKDVYWVGGVVTALSTLHPYRFILAVIVPGFSP
jgi:hypothetical protein